MLLLNIFIYVILFFKYNFWKIIAQLELKSFLKIYHSKSFRNLLLSILIKLKLNKLNKFFIFDNDNKFVDIEKIIVIFFLLFLTIKIDLKIETNITLLYFLSKFLNFYFFKNVFMYNFIFFSNIQKLFFSKFYKK